MSSYQKNLSGLHCAPGLKRPALSALGGTGTAVYRVDTVPDDGLTSNHCRATRPCLIGKPDEHLRLFLHDSVKSYEELEALLFLARHENRDFSAEAVTSALNATAGSLDEALEELASVGGIVEVTQRSGALLYRYAPRDEFTRQRVTDLDAAYAERRMSVVQMLSANALERVRRAAMRRLADAFLLGRGKK